MTETTQADRDAAEEHFDLWYPNTAWGYEPLVEAFARHRQQAIEALLADKAKLRDALFPFAEFHQLGGSMNDPISMWFRVAPFADAAYALQETER